jgi:hypothetical protein
MKAVYSGTHLKVLAKTLSRMLSVRRATLSRYFCGRFADNEPEFPSILAAGYLWQSSAKPQSAVVCSSKYGVFGLRGVKWSSGISSEEKVSRH